MEENGRCVPLKDKIWEFKKDERSNGLIADLTNAKKMDCENICGNPNTLVYRFKAKHMGRTWNHFFYITTSSTATSIVHTPRVSELRHILNAPHVQSRPDMAHLFDYWESTSANKMFPPLDKTLESGNDAPGEAIPPTNAYTNVEALIELLDQVLKSGDDPLVLVQGFRDSENPRKVDCDAVNKYDQEDVRRFRAEIFNRCNVLRASLQVASEHDGKNEVLN